MVDFSLCSHIYAIFNGIVGYGGVEDSGPT